MSTLIFAGLGLYACAMPPVDVGRNTYSQYCAQCHGESGLGDGPLAATLPKTVPNLTMIAAQNGGVFPEAETMSTIDGYFREGSHVSLMPAFGDILEGGETILYDTGDGIETPTPAILVDLVAYLEVLQKP
ncbi:MAG: c-type cytochrome [Hyphomicrobiales bacterium]